MRPPPPAEGLPRRWRREAALPQRRRWTTRIAALGAAALCCCCASDPVRPDPSRAACVPECLRANSCAELDGRLVAARQPLLSCIDEQARRGRLADAHRCYRSLRLLESARWWLSTIMGGDEMSSVYQPSETIRREFLCRIEQLSRARSPSEVERLYLDTIRSYP